MTIALVFIMVVSMWQPILAEGDAPLVPELKPPIKVLLNGAELSFDVPPQLINDRTMVPLRVIFEALGAEVEWDEDAQTVTALKDGIGIIMQIGNDKMYIYDGHTEPRETIILDAPPQLVDGRTLVPVRAVAEGFGAEVLCDGYTQTVIVRQEVEVDINAPEVQALFDSIISGESFASYYEGYVDVERLDSPETMWGGRMRELITVLALKDVQGRKYTTAEAREFILQFLSVGNIADDMSRFDLGNLKEAVDNGANFGEDADGDKYEQRLIGVYKKSEIDEISKKLFGIPLPKYGDGASSIAYASFFFYQRINSLERFPETLPCILYYNEASEEYMFTMDVSFFVGDGSEYYEKYYGSLKSETRLLRATRCNDEISLYLYHESEFGEYSGGTGFYKGAYKNTYREAENGFYWVSSFGVGSNVEWWL